MKKEKYLRSTKVLLKKILLDPYFKKYPSRMDFYRILKPAPINELDAKQLKLAKQINHRIDQIGSGRYPLNRENISEEWGILIESLKNFS